MGIIIQFISIFIEVVITILGLLIALQKKKNYGWGIALTFAIYTFYDFVGLTELIIQENIMFGLFFIATISALGVVWNLYNQGRKKK
jgi:hypothetical protein